MASIDDLRMVFYRDGVEVGRMTDFETMTMALIRNGVSTLSVTVRATHPLRADLILPRTRVDVYFRGVREFHGFIYAREGDALPFGTFTFRAKSDNRLLADTRAWVQPTAAGGNFGVRGVSSGKITPDSPTDLAQQWPGLPYDPNFSVGSVYSAWWMLDGVGVGGTPWYNATGYDQAGYFLRRVVSDNLQRVYGNVTWMGTPENLGGTIAIRTPDQPVRGNWVSTFEDPAIRFDTLLEATKKFTDWSDQYANGLNIELDFVDAAQNVGRPTIYLTEPPPEGPELTIESGAIGGGRWVIEEPIVTDVILGGPGENQDRAFYHVPADPERATELGRRIEAYKDATGAQLGWPESVPEAERLARRFLQDPRVPDRDKTALEAYFKRMAFEPLQQGQRKSGLSIDLLETEGFRFGGASGFRLGQKVTVNVSGGRFTERLEQVTISAGANGVSVTPKLGTLDETVDEAYARNIQTLATRVVQQSSRR